MGYQASSSTDNHVTTHHPSFISTSAPYGLIEGPTMDPRTSTKSYAPRPSATKPVSTSFSEEVNAMFSDKLTSPINKDKRKNQILLRAYNGKGRRARWVSETDDYTPLPTNKKAWHAFRKSCPSVYIRGYGTCKVCFNYVHSQGCKYGRNCEFAHPP